MNVHIRLLTLFFLVCGSYSQASDGSKLYAAQCARCHGANGEGVAGEYDEALFGQRSIPQLAKYIAKSMPSDDPGSVSLADAELIATHMHAAFYSVEARERNKPPRIELARLTVAQYRHTLADLVGSFRWRANPDGKTGLKAEYFAARNFNNRDRKLERIDPYVDFDFGVDPPKEMNSTTPEFSVRWSGMVYAPTTGDYEFIVHADQAMRLWINDPNKPLIDAFVRSGPDTEFRASRYLIGGRHYYLRLEFNKAKQGVNDSDKNKPKPVPAMIRLLWKEPNHAAEVIPARFLAPVNTAEQFICDVPFPPDDRSLGWERGTSITKEWDLAVTEGSLQATSYILANLEELAKTKSTDKDYAAKLQSFASKFTQRAFRRPLTDTEKRIFVERHFEAFAKQPEEALKRVLILVLKSPRFLYREPALMPTGHAIAARLSYMLTDSMPEPWTVDTPDLGWLANQDAMRKHAETLLKDPRTETKLIGFLNHWLGLEHHGELSKNPILFPEFKPELVNDLKTSLDLQLRELLRSPEADYRKLFTSQEFYVNRRIAEFYGASDIVSTKHETEFVPVKLNPGQRSGVLTHPYLLATFAYNAESSPIHRGVFLTRGILGQTLRPPMEAFTPFPADLHPKLTTRERTDLQTHPTQCQSCHAIINPLGYALENFDAVGKFRNEERGKPIDATGSYVTRTGEVATFNGPLELSKFLVNSPEAVDSFVQQLFHHLVQQPLRAYGKDTQADLSEFFRKSNYNIRELAIECLLRTSNPPRETTSNTTP